MRSIVGINTGAIITLLILSMVSVQVLITGCAFNPFPSTGDLNSLPYRLPRLRARVGGPCPFSRARRSGTFRSGAVLMLTTQLSEPGTWIEPKIALKVDQCREKGPFCYHDILLRHRHFFSTGNRCGAAPCVSSTPLPAFDKL